MLSLPVAGGHVFAAHEDFASGVKLHLAPGEDLANRTSPLAKGMIHADQRGCFGQPIPLDHCESELAPKLFGIGVESRAAANERPELPAEPLMDAAECPPAF